MIHHTKGFKCDLGVKHEPPCQGLLHCTDCNEFRGLVSHKCKQQEVKESNGRR